NAPRQNHQGTPVENDLERQANLNEGLLHFAVVSLRRGYDRAPRTQRLHAALAQLVKKPRHGRGRQGLYMSSGRMVEYRAILGNHNVKKIKVGEHRGQVFEFAAGNQNGLAAVGSKTCQRVSRRRTYLTAGGERFIVIACEMKDHSSS